MMNFAKTNALLQNDERFAEFIEKYRIELVIIFGSVAKNAKEAHDIDIAIQSKDQALPSQKLDLIYELSEFFSHDIDLTIININTDLLLLYEIVCGGKCIFERNDGMFLELKSLIWRMYHTQNFLLSKYQAIFITRKFKELKHVTRSKN